MNIIKQKTWYPVSLQESKDHLRISTDDTTDDNYIRNLIKVATTEGENYVGFDIAYTKNTVEIFDFVSDKIDLPFGNFQSLVSITDSSIAVSYDHIIKNKGRFAIELNTVVDSDPITVIFYTGFPQDKEDEGSIELIKQYILIRLSDLYEPERSSWSYGALRNTNTAEKLLSGLLGLY